MSEETPTSISEAFSSSAAGSLKCFDEEEAEGHDSDDDYLSSESEGDDVPGEDLEAGAVAAAVHGWVFLLLAFCILFPRYGYTFSVILCFFMIGQFFCRKVLLY